MAENIKGEKLGNWKLMQKCLDVDLKGSRKWVLIVLCSHFPNIFPSVARIAREAGIGPTTVKAAIKDLQREAWITKKRQYSESNKYTVNVKRIMSTPPIQLEIPEVEGKSPSLDQETDSAEQPAESDEK
jgi:hypothetical protein